MIIFYQFALNVWNYCVKGKSSIAEFAFDIFDTDNNQSLNEDEIIDMVCTIYGDKNLEQHVFNTIKKMDKNKDNRISKKEFVQNAAAFPALLFPAYKMQVNQHTSRFLDCSIS